MDDEYPSAPQNHGILLFRHFIGFLDQLENNKLTPGQRREIVNELCGVWRKQCGNDIFPCFRLLLPNRDTVRMFSLKEKRLALEFAKILRIDPKSQDAKSMFNWKDGNSAGVGDFARRCRDNIVKRQGQKSYSELNMNQINDLLDKLAESNDKKFHQKEVLETMLMLMNAHEMYWVIKIIIKNLNIHLSEKTALNCWHSLAANYFNTTSDLRRVCWRLYDESISIETNKLYPFLCFKPQIANFPMKNYDVLLSKIGSTQFYIEEKIDGERLQLHMVNDEFKYFSRVGNDNTDKYGKSYSASGKFTSLLKGFLNEKVKSIILDGEIVSWNEVEGMIEGFNRIKGAFEILKGLDDCPFTDINSDHLNSDIKKSIITTEDKKATLESACKLPHRHGLFIIYDVLYLNGKTLLNYPLTERRRVLEIVINPIEHVVELIKYTLGSTKEDISTKFMEVMERDGEGLVIKNPLSGYGLNIRDNNWIKVKPDYIGSLGESFDLLVIGGYNGNGYRAGKLASFLLGIRNSEKEEEDLICNASENNSLKYLSICRVGSGFTGEEYELIRKLFNGKIHKYDPSNKSKLPKCLDFGDMVPDVWIHPKDSIVLKVKGSEIVISKSFSSKITIRFPRFFGFRQDKNWRNATSLYQLRQIQTNSAAKRKLQEEELSADKFQIIKRRNQALGIFKKTSVNIFNSTDDTYVFSGSIKSTIFKDCQFYVLTSQRLPKFLEKKNVEKLIQEHSGSILNDFTSKDFENYLKYNTNKSSSNFTPKIYIIADLKTVGVYAIMQRYSNQTTFVTHSWIYKCIFLQKIIPLEPEHILASPESEMYQARCTVDRFGDSYYTKSSIADFKKTLSKVSPTSLELKNDHDLFRKARASFAKCVETVNDPGQETPANLLFSQNKIYFDFENRTLDYIYKEELQRVDAKYHCCIPSVHSSKSSSHHNLTRALFYARYGSAVISKSPFEQGITTIVCSAEDTSRVSALRKQVFLNLLQQFGENYKKPYFVTTAWIFSCWKEKTLLPEENFLPLEGMDYSCF